MIGYDQDRFESLNTIFVCSICTLVPAIPYECFNCENVFCKECI